jgi:Uncharacterized conserved protein (DUF2278)
MPLAAYGVAVGTLVRFYRDPPDGFGRWYHGHIELSTPSGVWTSALDVDTPTGVGVSYRVSHNLDHTVLGPVRDLADGFHLLTHDDASGAIDYVRSGFLQDVVIKRIRQYGLPRVPQLPPPEILLPDAIPRPPPPEPAPRRFPWLETASERLLRLLSRFRAIDLGPIHVRVRPWTRSDGDNALRALEAELTGTRRVYIFGERFQHTGQGVHDVHQNQGDPAGTRWWNTNGIWQDGAVAVVRDNGKLFFWQVRFNTQAALTDANGHPLQ